MSFSGIAHQNSLALQSQNTLTVYFSSQQLRPVGFARQSRAAVAASGLPAPPGRQSPVEPVTVCGVWGSRSGLLPGMIDRVHGVT